MRRFRRSAFFSNGVAQTLASIALAAALLMAAQPVLAQNPLVFGNNYFVTGDYVVGGVGLRGLGDGSGFATGTINIPDQSPQGYIAGARSVPAGAQIVAAVLYWETVESSSTLNIGSSGFFRPVFPGGPATGYPITGVVLGSPNAPPVSWSSGGCSGSSNGTKIIQAYRADVRALLPQDANGNVLANGSYEVRLADSGSNGGGVPLTLGATLVIIYRVMSPNFPLNSIVIYDGAFSSSTTSAGMSQAVQGFYQPTQPPGSPLAKLTHIVGNGQSNKYEQVFFGNSALTALNPAGTAAFPGLYNGSWDNPTWTVSQYVQPSDTSETTQVVPNQNNSGCVSWGAVIVSTTVQSSDNDGLLDVWKKSSPQGYCDASVSAGVCTPGSSPSWVDLTGATPGQKDIFVQLDYLCSVQNPDGTCDTTSGASYQPNPQAVSMVQSAFSAQGLNLHVKPTHAVQELTCTDSTSSSTPTCSYPNQPGVVGWKGGLDFVKNQLVFPNGTVCTDTTNTSCMSRFQHGRKDSYHYVLFGHALGLPKWYLQDGSLASAVASGNTVTFTTSTAHGLVANDTVDGNGRVIVANAITNPSLNGIYYVTAVPNSTTFQIQIASATNAAYTVTTDPNLAVAPGKAGTGSGHSDIGGGDSLISLGLWGADGQSVAVQAGTFMHELGHALALTHGGFYFDNLATTPNDYRPTVEANCKPNFQSVMNYLFQVDLLDKIDPQTNLPVSVPDYSEQQVIPLNENSLGSVAGLVTAAVPPLQAGGQPTTYFNTKWYSLSPPNGVGTAATRHCDGTPLSPNTDPDPTMYRVDGATDPITPLWGNTQDINFNGSLDASLRGYNDWLNLDLRQIGATGSLSAADGTTSLGGSGTTSLGGSGTTGLGGSGTTGLGGSGTTALGGSGTIALGGSGTTGLGGSGVDITYETANSVTHPPKNLTAVVVSTTLPRYIHLAWAAPFGQIGSYNVYRSSNNGASYTNIASAPGGTVAGATVTYDDHSVVCGPTYLYFVTAVLAGTNPPQESIGSNTAPQSPASVCAPNYVFNGFAAPLAAASNTSYSGTFTLGNTVPIVWTLQDYLGNAVSSLNVNTLIAIGPVPQVNGACPTPGSVQVFLNHSGTYPNPYSMLYSPQAPNSLLSSNYPSDPTKFSFNWATASLTAGCYVIELDLDSGQVERTGLQLAMPYIFTGFGSPLSTADPPNLGSYSGKFNLGKSVTVKWELQTSNGTVVSNLNANTLLTVGPIPIPSSGACPDTLTPVAYRFSGPGAYPYAVQALYSPTTGAKGNSMFRFSSPQFVFNWDTSTVPSGCYVLELDLDSGQVERTGLKLQ